MTLEVRGVTRRVGDRTLFEGLSFDVPAGATLCVRGPSGVGKTCLLRALAWLDPLEVGDIRLDGRTPHELSIPTWRTRVAYVAQGAPELPGTPREWLRRLATLKARGPLAEDPVELSVRAGLPPDRWDQPWARLSGGERQRVHLALALAGDPDVLLLDEPTSALDPHAVGAVEALLRGRTAVWVTHDETQAARVGTDVLALEVQ